MLFDNETQTYSTKSHDTIYIPKIIMDEPYTLFGDTNTINLTRGTMTCDTHDMKLHGVSSKDFEIVMRIQDGRSSPEDPTIKLMKSIKEPFTMNEVYRVCCDKKDLTPDKILQTISIMKARLYMETFEKTLKHIECKMTPDVKDNIIMAYRRTNMYGKKTPFVACFDEWGAPLPEKITLDTLEGMKIEIVKTDVYGSLYLTFDGILEVE